MDDALHNVNQWRSISSVAVLTLVLAWESLVPFLTYFHDNTGERVRHGLKNLALGITNSLLTGLGFVGLWWATTTPYMHKVHHSRWQPETDSNYSSLFSFWDRLFRSFRLRNDPRTLRFGLDEFNRPEDNTLAGLLATPLKQVQRATGEPPAKAPRSL